MKRVKCDRATRRHSVSRRPSTARSRVGSISDGGKLKGLEQVNQVCFWTGLNAAASLLVSHRSGAQLIARKLESGPRLFEAKMGLDLKSDVALSASARPRQPQRCLRGSGKQHNSPRSSPQSILTILRHTGHLVTKGLSFFITDHVASICNDAEC